MEERLAGGYAPSPGVIYPTLTMLEEEGLASVSNSDNKKVYSLTDQGTEFLHANKQRVDELFERLEEALQICLQMWGESEAPYEGRHYHLERTLNSPQPCEQSTLMLVRIGPSDNWLRSAACPGRFLPNDSAVSWAYRRSTIFCDGAWHWPRTRFDPAESA